MANVSPVALLTEGFGYFYRYTIPSGETLYVHVASRTKTHGPTWDMFFMQFMLRPNGSVAVKTLFQPDFTTDADRWEDHPDYANVNSDTLWEGGSPIGHMSFRATGGSAEIEIRSPYQLNLTDGA